MCPLALAYELAGDAPCPPTPSTRCQRHAAQFLRLCMCLLCCPPPPDYLCAGAVTARCLWEGCADDSEKEEDNDNGNTDNHNID
eukprot:4018093-Alexandrium_andersonii.AAC.1